VCLGAAPRVSDGWSGQGRVPHDYDERPAKAKGGQDSQGQPSEQESGPLSTSGQNDAGSGKIADGNSILWTQRSADTPLWLKSEKTLNDRIWELPGNSEASMVLPGALLPDKMGLEDKINTIHPFWPDLATWFSAVQLWERHRWGGRLGWGILKPSHPQMQRRLTTSASCWGHTWPPPCIPKCGSCGKQLCSNWRPLWATR